MINRFTKRRVIKNDSPIYSEIFEERGKTHIMQYDTPKFNYPTEKELENIGFLEYVWKPGDRLYKLANTYLGDKHNWWVILKFNKMGSEAEIKKGDVIKIPTRVEEIIGKML